MFPWRRIATLLLLLVVTHGGELAAQRRTRTERQPRAERPEEELRRKIRKRPPAERVRLEQHLEEFMKLPRPARTKLLERARALREREQALAIETPEDSSPQREARESRRGARHPTPLREGMKKAGREVRRRIPEDLRGRLERASPEQRRRFLERVAREREHLSEKAVEKLYARLELTPAEIRRFERMPIPERLLAMRKLEVPDRGEPLPE